MEFLQHGRDSSGWKRLPLHWVERTLSQKGQIASEVCLSRSSLGSSPPSFILNSTRLKMGFCLYTLLYPSLPTRSQSFQGHESTTTWATYTDDIIGDTFLLSAGRAEKTCHNWRSKPRQWVPTSTPTLSLGELMWSDGALRVTFLLTTNEVQMNRLIQILDEWTPWEKQISSFMLKGLIYATFATAKKRFFRLSINWCTFGAGQSIRELFGAHWTELRKRLIASSALNLKEKSVTWAKRPSYEMYPTITKWHNSPS